MGVEIAKLHMDYLKLWFGNLLEWYTKTKREAYFRFRNLF